MNTFSPIVKPLRSSAPTVSGGAGSHSEGRATGPRPPRVEAYRPWLGLSSAAAANRGAWPLVGASLAARSYGGDRRSALPHDVASNQPPLDIGHGSLGSVPRTADRLAGDPRFTSLRSADDAPRDGWLSVLGDAAVLALWAVACAVLLVL